MEETIHINVGGFYKTDTHHITEMKTRLWPCIIASLRWAFKYPIPGNNLIQNGIGLIIINNLAIAVEGFITDLLVDYVDTHQLIKPKLLKKIESSTWTPKTKIFNESFAHKLTDCEGYKSIEMLFLLRNNFAHGRTHVEMNTTEIATGKRSKIESVDKNYQLVRKFFYEKGLMTEREVSSNIEILWKIKISLFFLSEVKKFMFNVIERNKSDKFIGISAELNNCFQV